jgi:hypothetical protein
MPTAYDRDDQRRLITVTVTDPYSADDILSAIDRQAAEDTWAYALLYDLRTAEHMPADEAAQHFADRIKAAGGGQQRGPVGLALGTKPEQFRWGLMYTSVIRKLEAFEVLLTSSQLDAWLARNARRGSRPL